MDCEAAELCQNYIEGPQTRRRNHFADSPRSLCRMLTASLTTLMLLTETYLVLRQITCCCKRLGAIYILFRPPFSSSHCLALVFSAFRGIDIM
jgi:hypothetical protein